MTGPTPTKIAFAITDLDVGGAERALVEIATRLDRREWTPVVGCLGPRGPLADELEAAGVPVTAFGAKSSRNLATPFRLWRWLRRERPAILQTFLFHANVLGRIVARPAGVPHVVSGIRVADRRGSWRHRVDALTHRLAERHVCVSRAVADFTAEHAGIPRERLVVIPNGVDFDQYAQAEPADLRQLGLPADARAVLFVGRLDPQKDPLGLLEAFDAVAVARPDVHLVLAGDGPLRSEVEDEIARRGLDPRVHLLGRRDNVPALMGAATALVLPSRWEGMPNVVLEAMAAGLPVIATNVEGVADLIRDGETGKVVPAESPTALATAIEAVLADPNAAREMAEVAQHIVQSRFTWDASAAEYARLYRDLSGHVDEPPRSPRDSPPA